MIKLSNITSTSWFLKIKLILAVLLLTVLPYAGCEIGEDVPPGDDLIGTANFYFGNLHSHTGFSDGDGSLDDVLTLARDVWKYDFYAITDHDDQLSQSEWDETQTAVDAYNEDGKFIAIRGCEYSNLVDGHINTFNTGSHYTTWIIIPDVVSFYNWLDDNTGLGQFNHPGGAALGPGDFRELKYYDYVADNMFAIETGNKDNGNNSGKYLPYYTQALDLGWRLAPTNNMDNHHLDDTSPHRTCIIAENLTREDLYDAMRSRRIYSSDDPNMKIAFKAGDKWMGSEVSVQNGASVTFDIEVIDDEVILSVELITSSGNVADVLIPDGYLDTVRWSPSVNVSGDSYYFVKVTERNSIEIDEDVTQVAVTAPIWIKIQ